MAGQVMGAAVMAIPAGALGNAFSEVVEKEMNDEDRGKWEKTQMIRNIYYSIYLYIYIIIYMY